MEYVSLSNSLADIKGVLKMNTSMLPFITVFIILFGNCFKQENWTACGRFEFIANVFHFFYCLVGLLINKLLIYFGCPFVTDNSINSNCICLTLYPL